MNMFGYEYIGFVEKYNNFAEIFFSSHYIFEYFFSVVKPNAHPANPPACIFFFHQMVELECQYMPSPFLML